MLSALQASSIASAKDETEARRPAAGQALCAGHDLREMPRTPARPWQKALFEQCAK